MGKAKTKALALPASEGQFIEYLRELVHEGAQIEKTDDRLQTRLNRLEAMKKRLKEEAAEAREPHEERIRLLFAAVKAYFKRHRDQLLRGDLKSWTCEYATVGERLIGPSVRFVAKVAEIAGWLMKREWGWKFLNVRPSKKKMHGDIERAKRIPGVEIKDQIDEFFVSIPEGAFEFVRGKLRRKDEEEDEAA